MGCCMVTTQSNVDPLRRPLFNEEAGSTRRNSIVSGEAGTAILEFAVCLVFLMMISFGVSSLYFSLQEHSAVAEAARVGARAAGMLSPGTSANVVTETALNMASSFLRDSGYQPENYSLQVIPDQISLTQTGTVNMIRLSIRRPSGGLADFITRNRAGVNIVTEFPLAVGNSAHAEVV